jgi:4-amino-4-deoxy-L-arabinose transferase-like glycosyltransferase
MENPLKNDSEYASSLILLLVCAAAFAPFSNKAFHMDSPVTVYMARQLSQHPWNPALGHFGTLLSYWNHTDLPQKSAFYATPHPPLIPLYLAAFVKVSGEREAVLNWAMFPFFFLAVLFFFRLSGLWLTRWRWESTLLFLAGPVVFINAQNVMLDVPLAAFCMAAFFYLFRGRGAKDALYAGCFAALALLTKFTGVSVVVSGLLFFALSGKWRAFGWFLAPCAVILGLDVAHDISLWGTTQLWANGHAHYRFGDVRYRFERLASYAGGTVVLPVFPLLIYFFVKKLRFVTLCATGASALWAYLLFSRLHYSIPSAALYALCASAGFVFLYGTVDFLLKDNETARGRSLAAHVAIQIVGGGFLTLYAARYLLPAVFPCILFLASVIDSLGKRIPKKIVWAVLILSSATVSALLSISDYQFVRAERLVAQDIRAEFPKENVFYSGRLGYLYYADRAGFYNLMDDARSPAAGDIVLRNTAFYDDARYFTDTTKYSLVADLRYPLFPLRTMTGREGFYGDDRLPYALILPSKDREFLVYRKR